MNNICVDTGFLIGLYDETDQYHTEAEIHFDDYFATTTNRLIVPFPTIYETVSSRFVRNRKAMTQLNNDWTKLLSEKRLELISDEKYRDDLIDECFRELRRPSGSYRALSAVDRVLRRMLSDVDIRIEAFITFNIGDFADVCATFNRRIVS